MKHKSQLNILIGCEFSGVVRDEFIKLGYTNTVSCDYLPSESNLGKHYRGDIYTLLKERDWDALIVFPPCTYLCSSGLHWNKKRPERAKRTEGALAFVAYLLGLDIKYIALENPIGCISTRIRKPDQIIQPFWFGRSESKATCLFLKNLPPLKPTNILKLPKCGYWENQTPSKQNKLGPSKERAKIRSRTYKEIAEQMAIQWSPVIEQNS
jgi:hypothetical protein